MFFIESVFCITCQVILTLRHLKITGCCCCCHCSRPSEQTNRIHTKYIPLTLALLVTWIISLDPNGVYNILSLPIRLLLSNFGAIFLLYGYSLYLFDIFAFFKRAVLFLSVTPLQIRVLSRLRWFKPAFISICVTGGTTNTILLTTFAFDGNIFAVALQWIISGCGSFFVCVFLLYFIAVFRIVLEEYQITTTGQAMAIIPNNSKQTSAVRDIIITTAVQRAKKIQWLVIFLLLTLPLIYIVSGISVLQKGINALEIDPNSNNYPKILPRKWMIDGFCCN